MSAERDRVAVGLRDEAYRDAVAQHVEARIVALRQKRQAQYDELMRTAQARCDAIQNDLLKPLIRKVEQLRVQPAMHTNGELWWIEA